MWEVGKGVLREGRMRSGEGGPEGREDWKGGTEGREDGGVTEGREDGKGG